MLRILLVSLFALTLISANAQTPRRPKLPYDIGVDKSSIPPAGYYRPSVNGGRFRLMGADGVLRGLEEFLPATTGTGSTSLIMPNIIIGTVTDLGPTDAPFVTRTVSGTTVTLNFGLRRGAPATGDMLKSTYDTNNDGVVENSLRLGGILWSSYATSNDARFNDARTPTGAAGGFLLGSYPNPGVNEPALRAIVNGNEISHTTGLAVTVNASTSWLIVDPPVALTSLTINLPPSPVEGRSLTISFGGSIATGAVVNNLTLAPATGQTIRDVEVLSSVEAGESISYRYRSTTQTWYRIN